MKKKDIRDVENLIMGVIVGGALAYVVGLMVASGHEILSEYVPQRVIFVISALVAYCLCFFLVFVMDNLKNFEGKTESEFWANLKEHAIRVHKPIVIGVIIVLVGAFLYAVFLQMGVQAWG